MSIYFTKYKSRSKSKRRRRSKSKSRNKKIRQRNKSRRRSSKSRRCRNKSKRKNIKDGGVYSKIKKLFKSPSPEPPINIDKCSEGMKTLIDFEKYSNREELEQRIREYCSKTKYNDILLLLAIKNYDENDIKKHLELKKLLKKGVNPNLADIFGRTVLMYCAMYGNFSLFNILSRLNLIQINQKDSFGNTALIYAINKNDINFFEDMFAHMDYSILRKMFNEPDNEGIIPLFNIIKKSNINIDISKVLKFTDINDRDPGGNTAIIYAAYYNNPHILIELIQNYITIEKIKIREERGYIREQDNQSILNKVLPKIYHKNNLGMTALMYACEKGYSDIVKIIMDFATEEIKYKKKYEFIDTLEDYIFAKNNKGETCLIFIAKNGYVNIAKQLLNNRLITVYSIEDSVEFEKYINHKDNEGKTALDYACLNNKYLMVEFLKDKWVEESKENKQCTKLITNEINKRIASAPDILPTKTNIEIYRELPLVPSVPEIDFVEPIVLEKDPTIFKAEPIILEEDPTILKSKEVNTKPKRNLIKI